METHGLWEWFDGVPDRVERFVLSLMEDASGPLISRGSLTDAGAALRLAPACFAVKTLYAIGRWDGARESVRNALLGVIRSHQHDHDTAGGWWDGAFVDPVLYREADGERAVPSHTQRALAESKQAWCTLGQVGEQPARAYRGVPIGREAFGAWAAGHDWSLPWHAGGQLSGAAACLALRAEQEGDPTGEICARMEDLRSGFAALADERTGGYFRTARPEETPEHGQLVNGAMKVLSGQAWLGARPHHPELLIDTVLSSPPAQTGCHVVDALYVLHECQKVTDHRATDVASFAQATVASIKRHEAPDGGFSYRPGAAQQWYYGVQLTTEDEAVGDLHGTCLLTWGLALAAHLREEASGRDADAWRVLRP